MSPLTALLLLTSTAGAPSHAVAVAPVAMQQQESLTVKEAQPGLKAQAKVSSDSAMKTALAKVPGGTVSQAELEKSHGKVVYSFDITSPKKSGVEEVHVDAKSGKVLSARHETAAMEAKEHAAEAKESMPKTRMKRDTTMMKHDTGMMKRDTGMMKRDTGMMKRDTTK